MEMFDMGPMDDEEKNEIIDFLGEWQTLMKDCDVTSHYFQMKNGLDENGLDGSHSIVLYMRIEDKEVS